MPRKTKADLARAVSEQVEARRKAVESEARKRYQATAECARERAIADAPVIAAVIADEALKSAQRGNRSYLWSYDCDDKEVAHAYGYALRDALVKVLSGEGFGVESTARSVTAPIYDGSMMNPEVIDSEFVCVRLRLTLTW